MSWLPKVDWDEQMRIIQEIAEAPEPISYIVLDHSCSNVEGFEGVDSQGRRYVIFSPAIMDELQHTRYGGVNVVTDDLGRVASRLAAIPMYRRQDMPEGWPDEQP